LNHLLKEKKALQFLTLKELITKSFKLPSDYVVSLKRAATSVYCHEVYFDFKSAGVELNSLTGTPAKSTALVTAKPVANALTTAKPVATALTTAKSTALTPAKPVANAHTITHMPAHSDIITKFKELANSVHGSGFVWIVKEKSTEKLSVTATRNTETPNLNLLTPILCIDLWEHAYFLQYKYKRSDYINYFLKMALW
jgi:superoxide dismutase